MRKLLLSAAFVLGLSSAAHAACTSPAVMHDFPGTAFNMSLATAPDGNCASNLSFPNTTATGSITTTQSVTLTPSGGQSSVGIQVTGTWTGTLFVEGSVDGTNYSQTTIVPVLSGSIQTATITANGIWQANVGGLASFRVRGNSVASGTAVVTLIGSSGTATVMADNPFPVTGYTGMTALNVIGNTAIGSATTDKPLMMGGSSTGASGGNAQVAKVDSSGNQYVLPGTAANWGLGATGAAVPANTIYLGVNNGGNLLGWPAKAANTVAATDVVPEVAVANTNNNGPAAASASSPVTPSNLPPGAAAINTNQVSVAATAGGTLIVAARTGVAGTGRVSATVCNTGTTAVYIGNTGLTTATGQYLAGVAGACLTLNTTAAIYGIVATGTETVAYSETY